VAPANDAWVIEGSLASALRGAVVLALVAVLLFVEGGGFDGLFFSASIKAVAPAPRSPTPNRAAT
jgi:hypothetical protein